LHQKRQSVPLPPPINRFDFHAPEAEKSGSKDSQKTILPNNLPSLLSFSLSLPPAATTAPSAKPASLARPARAPPPPRQVTFLSPSASPSSSSPPMQNEYIVLHAGGRRGENNSPLPFLGRAGFGLALMSGPVQA